MGYVLFLDTNALLNLQDKAFDESFVISQKTLEEIENIKSSSRKDAEIKYKARKVARLLDEKSGCYTVVPINLAVKEILTEFELEETADNLILACAFWYNKVSPTLVVSDDINVKFISREIFGLTTKGIDSLSLVDDEEYVGYKDVTLSDEEMSYLYTNQDKNIYELLPNQYLIVRKSDGEVVDKLRWDGKEYKKVKYSQIKNSFIGKVKPLNEAQCLAFDLLQNKEITIKVLNGRWGSGKSFLCISNAIDMIQQGKFDRLVFLRNGLNVADIEEIGFIPGDVESKYAGYTAALADHLGGEQGLEIQIMQGNIVVEHLGFIRGRTYNNTIVYVAEAENLSKDNVQLIISRLGKNSEVWLDGDYRQVDSAKFRINNGLMSAINCLKGHPKFGCVKLNKTERSETAELAELLD